MTARILDDWGSQDLPDIYWAPAYVKLYANASARPRLFEFTDSRRRFLLPFLESDISAYFPDAPRGWRDMESAYGYGGPWTNDADPVFLAGAAEALEAQCRARGIVAGFIRFHPLLGNENWLPGCAVIPERETVCVDLTDEDMWMHQVSQRNRNKIRKAEKSGVTFETDPEWKEFGSFRDLYHKTMEALGAEAFYRFPEKYFLDLKESFPGHSLLAHCRHEGKIISSCLLLHWGTHGHYHLAGSSRAHQDLLGNNLMMYGAMQEMRRLGMRVFHLGGGMSSDPEDLLLRFKRSFSHHTRKYHIGKKIFLTDEYARLRALWEAKNPGRRDGFANRILFYRH